MPASTSLTGLTTILGGLSGAAQAGSDAPDATALAGFAKAKVMVDHELAAWNQLKTQDVAQLNLQLKQANLAPIDLAAAAPGRGGRRGGSR